MTFVTSRRKGTWRLVLVTVATVALLFAVNAGNLLVVNDPKPSDVAVVLAGETEQRPARAVQLLTQGYAKRAVIDVPATAKVVGFTEIELARQAFQKLPQADAIQICPITALSTRDEVHDVEKCVTDQEKSVLIVTSDFHTRRALSIFRKEWKGKTFSAAAAQDSTQFGVRWWQHRQWAKTLVDEWLRVIWWNGVDRWR
jgi:uncharacterized SAM-binding protein YcdF (DUF218 family)